MIRKTIAAAAIALSGVFFTTTALAQAFLGGSIGQSDVDEEVASGLITSGSVDGKDTAWKLFGGYMFNRHFGIEGAYVNLGEVTYSGEFFGSPVTDGKVEITGFSVAALGNLPINEQFSVFGKLGLFVWEAEASDITGGVPFSAKTDGTDLMFGIGLGYQFTRNLGVRAEYEMFAADEADAGLVSVGIVWRF